MSEGKSEVKIEELSIDQLSALNQELTEHRAAIREKQVLINLRIDVLTIAADMAKKHKIKPDLISIEKAIVESRMTANKKKEKKAG